MKSLLLVAHGSRREASNQEVRTMTKILQKNNQQQEIANFAAIRCAFLELANPSIPEGIDQCIEAQTQTIIVMPYFLSAGRHVSVDIPEIVAKKQAEYPNKEIILASHLGAIEEIPDLILSSLQSLKL